MSKRFISSQQQYTATLNKCLAVVLAVAHLIFYIWGRNFVCVTDHSAPRYLYSMQDTSNMLTQWAIALQSCDFSVEHKPGKFNVISDTLSRLFNLEYSEMGSHHIWLAFVGTYPTILPYMDRPDEAYQWNLHILD